MIRRLNRDLSMRHITITLVLLMLGATSVSAQTSDSSAATRRATLRAAARARREADQLRRRPDLITEHTMARAAQSIAALHGIGRTLLTSSDEQTTYLLIRRATSSRPEVHARWEDVVLVRAGTGAIELGDSLRGSTYRAPGERAGGTIVNSYRLVVHAGDIVRIPAAVPHAFIVSGADPLEYLVIKQRRPQLPLRWTSER